VRVERGGTKEEPVIHTSARLMMVKMERSVCSEEKQVKVVFKENAHPANITILLHGGWGSRATGEGGPLIKPSQPRGLSLGPTFPSEGPVQFFYFGPCARSHSWQHGKVGIPTLLLPESVFFLPRPDVKILCVWGLGIIEAGLLYSVAYFVHYEKAPDSRNKNLLICPPESVPVSVC
jgi:hypothetical protein